MNELRRLEMEDREIIRASLVAGLNLWGRPNIQRYENNVSKWVEKLEIKNYEVCKTQYGSGLIWYRDEGDPIFRGKMSERVREQSDAVGFDDEEECFGNSMIDDSEYVFNLKGKGFTGYSSSNRFDFDGELFKKRLRSEDGKLYTCWAGEIFIYEMDIDSVKECRKFIKKLIKENKGRK